MFLITEDGTSEKKEDIKFVRKLDPNRVIDLFSFVYVYRLTPLG